MSDTPWPPAPPPPPSPEVLRQRELDREAEQARNETAEAEYRQQQEVVRQRMRTDMLWSTADPHSPRVTQMIPLGRESWQVTAAGLWYLVIGWALLEGGPVVPLVVGDDGTVCLVKPQLDGERVYGLTPRS